MFIRRMPEADASYRAKANKKTKVNLENTFQRPPAGHLEGVYIRTLTLEGVFGYTPVYAEDEIQDNTSSNSIIQV